MSDVTFNVTETPLSTLNINKKLIKEWAKRIHAIHGYTCFYDSSKNELNMYDPEDKEGEFGFNVSEELIQFYEKLKHDFFELDSIHKITFGSNEYLVCGDQNLAFGLDYRLVEQGISMLVLNDIFSTRYEDEDTLIRNGVYLNISNDLDE